MAAAAAGRGQRRSGGGGRRIWDRKCGKITEKGREKVEEGTMRSFEG